MPRLFADLHSCRVSRACMGVLSLLVLVLTPVAQAQQTASAPTRPRVGLVLSGGGARGIAHIGVLKVLEDLHIPIDAIAGTSMGALVGGLYASGMNARDIENLVSSLDWQAAFRDRPPRTTLGFRRKQDDRNFLVRYSLGVGRDGFELPTGLIQGQNQTQILRSATLPVADITDFSKLPIPFKAVATDLESGREVVMDSGDLATAMRASMSAPGVFIPVERDGHMLVDGGLVDNLPIEIARQMNVDVLIVVDVSFPLYGRDELTSPLAITNQAAAIMVRNRTLEKRQALRPDDIIIDPDLGAMSSVDFSRAARALSVGSAAAQANAERLKSLSVDAATYRHYVAARTPGLMMQLPQIDFVQPAAGSQRYASAVQAVMGDLQGQQLDRVRINEDLSALYALDLFEAIDYKLVHRDEQTGLEFHLKPKTWGPNYVRVGINLEDDFAGNSRYNLAGRLIMTDLNALGAEWLTDAQIGDRPRFATEFYQPLSWQHRYFVAPRLEYGVRTLPVLSNDEVVAEYRVRSANAALDLGRELSNWGELRVGVQRGSGSTRVLVGDPSLPTDSYATGGYFLRFSYDTLDNVFFPRHGMQLTTQWSVESERFGADRSAKQLTADWQLAKSFGRYTVILATDVGSNFADNIATRDYFSLGGFLNLSGLASGALSGPHYGVARLIYYRQIGRGGSGVLDLPSYAGISLEAGNTWAKRSDASFSSLRHDASLFFGADTPLGPLYLAAGIDEDSKSALYLFLGRSF